MGKPGTKQLVIGVGNEFRGDDAVGRYIVRKLAALAPPDVCLAEESGEGSVLMECWLDAESVTIIDAVSTGAQPGTVFRFDAVNERLPAEISTGSSHSFSLQEAIELSRALGQLPASLIVYGIEGQSFKLGNQLSSAVEEAADEVLELLISELKS